MKPKATKTKAVKLKVVQPRNGQAPAAAEFSAQAFLDSTGVSKTVVQYGRDEAIFTQGDVSEDVMYIRSGGVKLSVLSTAGKEAVVVYSLP